MVQKPNIIEGWIDADRFCGTLNPWTYLHEDIITGSFAQAISPDFDPKSAEVLLASLSECFLKETINPRGSLPLTHDQYVAVTADQRAPTAQILKELSETKVYPLIPKESASPDLLLVSETELLAVIENKVDAPINVRDDGHSQLCAYSAAVKDWQKQRNKPAWVPKHIGLNTKKPPALVLMSAKESWGSYRTTSSGWPTNNRAPALGKQGGTPRVSNECACWGKGENHEDDACISWNFLSYKELAMRLKAELDKHDGQNDRLNFIYHLLCDSHIKVQSNKQNRNAEATDSHLTKRLVRAYKHAVDESAGSGSEYRPTDGVTVRFINDLCHVSEDNFGSFPITSHKTTKDLRFKLTLQRPTGPPVEARIGTIESSGSGKRGYWEFVRPKRCGVVLICGLTPDEKDLLSRLVLLQDFFVIDKNPSSEERRIICNISGGADESKVLVLRFYPFIEGLNEVTSLAEHYRSAVIAARDSLKLLWNDLAAVR